MTKEPIYVQGRRKRLDATAIALNDLREQFYNCSHMMIHGTPSIDNYDSIIASMVEDVRILGSSPKKVGLTEYLPLVKSGFLLSITETMRHIQ